MAVLSNNDGCIIARSPEVKALGIPMGAPYFKYEELFRRHRVVLFSSNYTLYGDLSARVMETLSSFGAEMEVYSIDEAFLWYDGNDLYGFCKEVKKRIKQWVGIPVSVGCGPTKTLAKVANELAKKRKDGILTVNSLDPCLKKMGVEEIWGIGPSKAALLRQHGIYSAEELALANEAWVQKKLHLGGLLTARELRGVSCLSLEESPAPKKGVMNSRSFGQAVMDLPSLKESVAYHAASGAEDIRSQGSAASFLQVYLLTSRFDARFSSYSRVRSCVFEEATSYSPKIIGAATSIVASLYMEGIPYKKTGVFLGGLIPEGEKQMHLFGDMSIKEREKQERLMAVLDQLNERKSDSLFFLAEGIEKGWKMKRSLISPSYTTSWDELPRVKAN